MKWSPEEDAILSRHYRELGVDGVRDLLPGRSSIGIVNRASRLGIPTQRIWTAEEDRVIQVCYPSLGAAYCCKYLRHRTVAAIHTRAIKLGVRRRRWQGIKQRAADVDYLLVHELANHRPWRKKC